MLHVLCDFGLQSVVYRTPNRLEEQQRRRVGIDAGECTSIFVAGYFRGLERANCIEVGGRGQAVRREICHGRWPGCIPSLVRSYWVVWTQYDGLIDRANATEAERRGHRLLRRGLIEVANVPR